MCSVLNLFHHQLCATTTLNACLTCHLKCWLQSSPGTLHWWLAIHVIWFMMELPFSFPSVLPMLLLLFIYGTSTSWEFRHWVVCCNSTTTHVVTINCLLRDTIRTHISVPGLFNIGGLSPETKPLITNIVPSKDNTRIFPMAQTQKPILFVPSAWAPTCTMYMHATPPDHGTADMLQWPKDTKETFTCERTMFPSAWTGKGCKAVPVPSTTPSIFAWDVVQPLTELTDVLECRKHKELTPYHPDMWEDMLQEARLMQKYPHIV